MTSRNCLHLINTVIHVKGQSHSQLKHESFSVLQFGAFLRLCEDLRMEEASVLMFLTLLQTHQAVLRETPLHQCLLIHGHLSLHLICNCVKQTQWRFVQTQWNVFSLVMFRAEGSCCCIRLPYRFFSHPCLSTIIPESSWCSCFRYAQDVVCFGPSAMNTAGYLR